MPEDAYEVPIGKANVVRSGSALTIVTYGTMVQIVKEVVEEKKVDAEIIDLRTINPLDEETIINSVKKTGKSGDSPRGAPQLRRGRGDRGEDSGEGDIRALGSDNQGRIAEPARTRSLATRTIYIPNAKKIASAIDRVHGFVI